MTSSDKRIGATQPVAQSHAAVVSMPCSLARTRSSANRVLPAAAEALEAIGPVSFRGYIR